MSDLATRTLIEESGSSTGELLFALLDQSHDCIKLLSPDGAVDFMNRNGRAAMEIDDFCSVAGADWWGLWPEEAKAEVERSVRRAQAGETSNFEAFCPTAKGTPKWWDVSVSPVMKPDGTIHAIVSISRDVTDKVKAREALRELAFEMRHRLRNAYSVAAAIAHQSARDDGLRAFAETLGKRFALVAESQSRELDADGRAWSLAELVASITGAHAADPGHFEIGAIDPVALSPANALIVALVLGELATNSLKYGALREHRPVEISSRREGDALTIEWREPAERAGAETAAGHGSGIGMMERMARAHRGRFEAKWDEAGLVATLSLVQAG